MRFGRIAIGEGEGAILAHSVRGSGIALKKGEIIQPAHIAALADAGIEAPAQGQGTMNNVTFGTERYQYYETVAGGSPAGPGFDGADVVQTHMTNSLLTDPEVLEARFPVRLESFGIRSGSGGAGRWRGGDGGRRRIRFLEPMTVSLLANSRIVPPFGLAGGGPGAPGRAWVERAAGGVVEELGHVATVAVSAGDALVVETPGGGGFGPVTP